MNAYAFCCLFAAGLLWSVFAGETGVSSAGATSVPGVKCPADSCLFETASRDSGLCFPAVKVTAWGLRNCYRVDSFLYRSEQPDDDEFEAMERDGVKSVLNLRHYHSDADEAEDTQLKLYRMRLDAGKLTEADLRQMLIYFREAPKPMLVHCYHGSDRTGAMVAAYRIVFQGVSVDSAVDELVRSSQTLLRQYPHVA